MTGRTVGKANKHSVLESFCKLKELQILVDAQFEGFNKELQYYLKIKAPNA